MRALLPGLMHGLSDVRLEAQLARDRAFRRFCRLEIDAGTPRASTPGRFRMALEAEGRPDAVLGEINRQLAQSGVIIERGRIAIVDATVVEAARSGREGVHPGPDPEGGNRVKADARGRKRGTWGCQGFVAVDEDQFIQATAMTQGHEGEIHQLEGLVERPGPVEAVCADSACSAARVRDWLVVRGIADRIQRKGYRDHPPDRAERRRNAGIAEVRALVEPVFGTLKTAFRLARSRFPGLARNRCQWQLAAIAWNLAKGARFKARFG